MSRTVFITGCSSGFGHNAAIKFARQGDRVYATMRGINGKNAEVARGLQDLAKQENLDIRVLELDVTSDSSVDAAAKTVLAESGAPDVVINNAGQMYVGLTEAFTTEEFARQMDINVLGIHRVTRALLPAMRGKGTGLFINISSVAGRMFVPFFGVYCASKYAVEGYSGALRSELASSGVDVVVVEPGPFATELFGQSPAPADTEGRSATYPDVVHQTQKGMGEAFGSMFADPSVPTDPMIVVDLFLELAAMKPGTRKAQYAVGVNFGVDELNKTTEAQQAGVFAGMGMTDFVAIQGS